MIRNLRRNLSIMLVTLLVASSIAGCGSPKDKLQETTGISSEQASTAMNILKDIGTTEFDDTHVLNKDKQMYYVNDKKYGEVFFRLDGGTIASVENNDGTVIYSDGQKLFDLSAVTLTPNEQAEFQSLARDAVSARLKAPATAEFDNWKLKRSKDEIMVVGTVDAQNTFGAKARHSFIVTINFSSKKVTSINFL